MVESVLIHPAHPEVAPERKQIAAALGNWRSAALVFAVAALGWWLCAHTLMASLWTLWTTDGLRSIGLLVIPTCAILAMVAWQRSPQSASGTWWGLALVGLAMLGAQISSTAMVSFHLEGVHGPGVRFLPAGVLLFAYWSGVVLLFLGVRGWRTLLFPLALLLMVNPVPDFFQRMLDLPLQHIGASTARAFAGWLKTPLYSQQLKLMFSPSLGMFIAPGCNGLRGSVAMAYLTLVLGFVRAMRPEAHALYVIAGVSTAYLFNLIRLCALVICYRVALNVDFLARHMEGADYVIGGLLFLCAAYTLFGFPRLLERRVA